jgi:hypothetical protein
MIELVGFAPLPRLTPPLRRRPKEQPMSFAALDGISVAEREK